MNIRFKLMFNLHIIRIFELKKYAVKRGTP